MLLQPWQQETRGQGNLNIISQGALLSPHCYHQPLRSKNLWPNFCTNLYEERRFKKNLLWFKVSGDNNKAVADRYTVHVVNSVPKWNMSKLTCIALKTMYSIVPIDSYVQTERKDQIKAAPVDYRRLNVPLLRTSNEHEEKKKKTTLEHNSHCVSSAPEPCHVFGVVQETVPSSGTHAQMNSIIVQNDPPRVWNPLPPAPLHLLSLPDPIKQTLYPHPSFLMDQTGSTGVSTVTTL